MKALLSYRVLILFITTFCLINNFLGQQKILSSEEEKRDIIEQRLQLLAEELEDDNVDFTTLMDVLSSYYEHPINLNKKGIKEDLQQLHLLSDFQINNLLEHIKKNGKIMSVYELQAIDGFDVQTIQKIMPFVAVNTEFYSPHTSFKEMMDNATNALFLRYTRILEEQKGYTEISDEDWKNSENARYLGSPDRLYMRYRFKYLTNVSIGFTAEKDAGESFLGNKRAEELFGIQQQKGFDFYSAHFYLKNVGKIKGLAIGDYHMQLGQGLTFWTGLAFGKMVNVMSFKRNARGIRPYASVDENNFLRGAAITYKIAPKIEVTAFGSRKKIDANIADNDSTNQNIDGVSTFTSFQTTGNHNTVGTLKDKHSLDETYAGGNIKYVSDNFHLGVTGVYSAYGGNIERQLKPYSQFQFNNNQNVVIGADYSYIYKNFNAYGEVSRSKNGGTAQLHGLLASLDPKLSASLLYRNYGKDYQSIRSNALAESSTNTNEKGLLFGIEARPNRHWIIDAYMDQFKFPWLRYLSDKPNTTGRDALIQVKHKPSKKLEMYIRLRNRIKPKNNNEGIGNIPVVVDETNWYYRFHVVYKIGETITLKNRVEYRTYKRGNQAEETGYLIYQDIAYKPLSSPFSFTFRYALFDTDSYNTRIYAYENNVLYAYAIPAYYNRGTRTQFTLRYRIKKGIDLWLRWAQWFYSDVETIGTGLATINGNTKTEVIAQLRFKF